MASVAFHLALHSTPAARVCQPALVPCSAPLNQHLAPLNQHLAAPLPRTNPSPQPPAPSLPCTCDSQRASAALRPNNQLKQQHTLQTPLPPYPAPTTHCSPHTCDSQRASAALRPCTSLSNTCASRSSSCSARVRKTSLSSALRAGFESATLGSPAAASYHRAGSSLPSREQPLASPGAGGIRGTVGGGRG